MEVRVPWTSWFGCSRACGAKDERLFRWSSCLTEGQVLDAGEFTIGCFPVRHRDSDSLGFSFESQVRRHLRPDRLAALGVPDGPVRKELAEGRPVTLADGRMVDPKEVLGPPQGRKKLVIVGDT
jgi:ribonuclease Z